MNFSGKSGDKLYAIEIEFYGKVDPESMEEICTDRCHVCVFKKNLEESKDPWPRLLSTTQKQHWLRVDFSTWKDLDEEEEDDFSKLYPGPDLDSCGDMGMNLNDFNPSGNSDDDPDGSSSAGSDSSDHGAPMGSKEDDVKAAEQNKEPNLNEPVSAS